MDGCVEKTLFIQRDRCQIWHSQESGCLAIDPFFLVGSAANEGCEPIVPNTVQSTNCQLLELTVRRVGFALKPGLCEVRAVLRGVLSASS